MHPLVKLRNAKATAINRQALGGTSGHSTNRKNSKLADTSATIYCPMCDVNVKLLGMLRHFERTHKLKRNEITNLIRFLNRVLNTSVTTQK